MSLDELDLRVKKTLEAIQNALVGLVAEKGLDAITVGDIACHAQVNRTTFYRHYRDKYGVLETILTKALAELDTEMGPPELRRSRFSAGDVPEPWVRFFVKIEANAELYRAILHSSQAAWFQTRLCEHVENLLRSSGKSGTASNQRLGKGVSSPGLVPAEVASAFSAKLFVGVAIWWLESSEKYDAMLVATWLRHFFLHGYLGVSGSVFK